MIATLSCFIVLATSAHAGSPVLDRIRGEQARTHDCQRQLGVPPTPVSSKPPKGAAYARWVLDLWRARADAVCSVVRAANRDPRVAVRVTFGPKRYPQAIRVATCESRLDTQAVNGQYQGTWQMGAHERATYGHGDTPLEQGFAARRYFDAVAAEGRNPWSPWECAYLTGVI